MANPSKTPPPATPPQQRPSLDEVSPFFVSDEDLERYVKDHFPPTPEGRKAIRAAVAAADKTVQERFAAAGWKLDD